MSIASKTAFVRSLALGAALCGAAAAPAFAQSAPQDDRGWLERRVDGLERGLSFFGGRDERAAGGGRQDYVQPAQSSSVADIAVRLDRLENQMRQLNGRIEEMQYSVRRNEEALKRFQGDVDFRIQDLESGKGGGGKSMRRGDAEPPSTGTTSTASSSSPADRGSRSADGGAGAPPAALGQTRSSSGSGDDMIGGLIEDDPNGPMSIRPPGVGGGGASSDYGATARGGDLRTASRSDSGVTAGAGAPRDQFDLGVGFVQRRDYDQAEATFRDFLRSHPEDAKAPEARYWLGESLYQRRKYTDAADSFFTIYKDAPNSAKAPESMLKLGMSLNGMGKREEACATIAEAGKKYVRIKAQSDRELKRLSC